MLAALTRGGVLLFVRSRKSLVTTVAVAAGAVYILLWAAVAARWAWLDVADTWTLQRFHEFGVHRRGWIDFWVAVSGLLNVLRFVAVVAVVVALVRHQFRLAAFLLLTVAGMGVVTATAKAISERPRPDTALAFAASTAFPSGHALGMTVGVLAIITVLWPRMTGAMRGFAVVVGAAVVLTVSLARVALNVHHPSDVVAGWALGIVYYLLCMVVVKPWIGSVPPQESDLASPE